MKCPNCENSTLVIAERAGIEIDHCPQCRGVWLDRGELDKIMERSRAQNFQHRHHEEYHSDNGRKRRKSFFEDLFD